MGISLEITIGRLMGYPLHCQTDKTFYRTSPPESYHVCPHCKRPVIPYLNHCDSHPFETYACPQHGAVVPIKSAVMNDYPTPDWSAA